MISAVEKFFRIRDGNLVNLVGEERMRLAENIQIVATGEKSSPSLLIIDRGEGQTLRALRTPSSPWSGRTRPASRLSKASSTVAALGSFHSAARKAYQLILSRRCPDLPSGSRLGGGKDPTHDGGASRSLVDFLPVPASTIRPVMSTLAPNGEIPRFMAADLLALPELGKHRC